MDLPLYMAVRREACELHLSEHFGDGTPGTYVRIEVADVAAMSAELNSKDYKYAKPGWQRQPWGWDEMGINDPAGNKLIFVTPHDE